MVEVDSQDAASTFAQIHEAGATVLSKLGHLAVISIPAEKVDALVAIEGDEPAVDSNLWFDIIGRSYKSKPTAPGIYIHSGKKYIIK